MRRPWFQLHLSTCIVLMFAAGGLLWANIVPGKNAYWGHGVGKSGHTDTIADGYGMPILFRFVGETKFYSNTGLDRTDPFYKFDVAFLLLNILANVVLLTTVLILSEWLIRRRKRAL